MLKLVAALILGLALTAWLLYEQVGKTAETKVALDIFQSELAARVEENKRIQQLLITREAEVSAIRRQASKGHLAVQAAVAAKPPDDCVNVALPDDIAGLLKR